MQSNATSKRISEDSREVINEEMADAVLIESLEVRWTNGAILGKKIA